MTAKLAEGILANLESKVRAQGPWRDEYEERLEALAESVAARVSLELVTDAASEADAEELDRLIQARVANLQAAGLVKAGELTRTAVEEVFTLGLQAIFRLL